jgi:hypothetical protein
MNRSGAVFISYDSKDLKVAHLIAAGLEKHSLTVWMDRTNLTAGKKWEEEIRNSIKNEVRFFIMLLSKSSLRNKSFFKTEYELAVERLSKGEEGFTIIPVCIEDLNLKKSALPEEIKQLHAIKLSADGDLSNIFFEVGVGTLKQTHPFIEGCWVGYSIEDVTKFGGSCDHVFPCYAELKIDHNIITGFVTVDYRGIGESQSAELRLHGRVAGNTIMFDWVNKINDEHRGLTTLDIISEELFAGHFNARVIDSKRSGVGKAVFHKVRVEGYILD